MASNDGEAVDSVTTEDSYASVGSRSASPSNETERDAGSALRNVARALFIPVTAGDEDALSPRGTNNGLQWWGNARIKLEAVSALKNVVGDERRNCCTQLAELRKSLRQGDPSKQVDGGPTRDQMQDLKKNLVKEVKNLLFVVKIRPYSEARDRDSENLKLRNRVSDYEDVTVTEAKPCPKKYQVVVSDCYGWSKRFNVSGEIKKWALGDNLADLQNYIDDDLQTPRAEDKMASVPRVTWPDVYFENIKALESNKTLFRTGEHVKHFEDIHPPSVLPEELFGEVQPLVAASIEEDGGDTVIIAYGKRNSGKTYTLHDTVGGVTRSIASYIFDQGFTVRCKFLDFSIHPSRLGAGNYVYRDNYSYVTLPKPGRGNVVTREVPDISLGNGHPFKTWVPQHESLGEIYAFDDFGEFDETYKSIIGFKKRQEENETRTHRSHFVTVIEILKKGEAHNRTNKKIYIIDLFDENEEDLSLELKEIVKSDTSLLTEFTEDEVMKKLTASTKKLMKDNAATAELVHAIEGRSSQNETLRKLLKKVVKEGDADAAKGLHKGLKARDDQFKGRLEPYAYGETKTGETTGNQRFAQTLDWVLRSRNGKPTRGLVFMCLDPYDEEGSTKTLDLLPWVEKKQQS